MEDKIFNFTETRDALGQLSADLVELESLIKTKQKCLKTEQKKLLDKLASEEEKTTLLRQATEKTLAKIENINQYIEKAL